MSIFRKKVSFVSIISVWIGASLWVTASSMPPKIYDIPKAMVLYTISGGGPLNKEVNLTISGTGKLRFKEWGAVELFEAHIVEETNGTLYYRNSIDICEKRQKKQILDVDYKNRKILERPLPKGKTVSNMTKGLNLTGQQMVGNVVCDMWESEHIRKCIYKGIPLFTEYRIWDFFYREAATEVIFDINDSASEKCAIPDFPIQKFSLLTGTFKTKNHKAPKNFSDRVLRTIEEQEQHQKRGKRLTHKEKKRLMLRMGEPIFEKQKKLLPMLLNTLKETRACLLQVQNTEKANQCLEPILKIKPYFARHAHIKIASWEEEKEKVLNAFDEKITLLEPKMKCIRASKNISDLSMCMKP